MIPKSKNLLFPLIVVALGMAAFIFLSASLGPHRPKLPAGYDDSDLALQGKRLKGFVLGYEGLVADWYWIMSLQYLGNKLVAVEGDLNIGDLTALNPRLLYPYLDNATDLDPKMNAAYSFGAAVLPAIDRDQAIALTKKGIANNPDNWRLYQYLGYIYWRSKDFDASAETYEAGSRVPGAPPFMREMVAVMRSRGGSRETARSMYAQILAEAEDEQSKRNAQLRLHELRALDEMEAVNAALNEAKTASGQCPARVSQIFPRLQTVRLPGEADFSIDRTNNLVDPTGVPYLFDQAKCEIRIDPAASKIPILSHQ